MPQSNLETLRQSARSLLNEFDAADALASYYALHHPAQRSTLFVSGGPDGNPAGFVVRCQTGFDLFRPVVTLRVRGADVPESLLHEGLEAGRSYLLIVPEGLFERLEPGLDVQGKLAHRVLRLDPARFQPMVNVMVMSRDDPAGNPVFEIRRGDRALAVSGVNWRSPDFAEVYVQVESEAQGRGWGRAVTAACVSALLQQGTMPIYYVADNNLPSRELAEQLGFVDTGAREIVAQVALRAG